MSSDLESATITSLSEGERRQALERFGVLRPHVEDGVSLAQLARQKGVPLRTLERWLRQYHRLGLGGLVRQPYANRGRRRLPVDLQHAIEALALRRPTLSTAAVHREATAIARTQGWPEPSYAT